MACLKGLGVVIVSFVMCFMANTLNAQKSFCLVGMNEQASRHVKHTTSLSKSLQLDIDIPVAFHIIHTASGTGNINDSVIEDQIDVLNSAFAGTGVSFYLYHIDRTSNDDWFDDLDYSEDPPLQIEHDVKQALAIDPEHVLNIYTSLPPNVLGWARFPWDYDEDHYMHGVVLSYTALPGGGAGYPEYVWDEGDIGVHEVGHYLGLWHTFRGGCSGAGDEVNDTPYEYYDPSDDEIFECTLNRDTCPSQPGYDSIDNYMNYTDDDCRDEFTQGQITRMETEVNYHKPELGNSVNICGNLSSDKRVGNIELCGNLTVLDGVTLNVASGATITLNGYSIACQGSGKIVAADSNIPFESPYAAVTNYWKTEYIGAYQSIQSAINKAGQQYAHVWIGSGTYNGSISLKNFIQLHGASKENTIINGYVDAYYDSYTRLEDLHITGSVEYYGGQNVIIENSIIDDDLWITSTNDFNLVHVEFQPQYLEVGIYLEGAKNGYASQLTIPGRYESAVIADNHSIMYVSGIIGPSKFCLNYYDVISYDSYNRISIYDSEYSYSNPWSGIYKSGSYDVRLYGTTGHCTSFPKVMASSYNKSKQLMSNGSKDGDSVRDAYFQAYDAYLAIHNSIKLQNEIIDYQAHKDEYQAAIDDFEQIISQFPGTRASICALTQIAQIMCNLDRKNEASQLIESFEKNEVNKNLKNELQNIKIDIAIKAEQYDEAITYSDEYIQNSTKDETKAKLQYRKALIYLFGKESSDQANKEFEQILAKYPGTPEARKAAARLGLKLEEQETENNKISTQLIPETFGFKSYPNPFNPVTTLSYKLPEDGHVSLIIYNVRGQLIQQILNTYEKAGNHKAMWNGKNSTGNSVSSGLYIVKLIFTNAVGQKQAMVKKISLVR